MQRSGRPPELYVSGAFLLQQRWPTLRVIVHALHVTVENQCAIFGVKNVLFDRTASQLPRSGRAIASDFRHVTWLRNPAPAGSHLVNRALIRIKTLFANPAHISRAASSPFNSACLYPAMRRRVPARNFSTASSRPCFPHYRPSELRLEQVFQSKPYNLMIISQKKAQRNILTSSKNPH